MPRGGRTSNPGLFGLDGAPGGHFACFWLYFVLPYRVDSNLTKVPLAHGISTPRSMNFELGFGVCLYKTEIILGFSAKLLIERLRSSTEYLIFKFS